MEAGEESGGLVLTLNEAVRRGLIQFEVRGIGQGITSEIEVRITKLTDDSFTLDIPAGTQFVPYDRYRFPAEEGPNS